MGRSNFSSLWQFYEKIDKDKKAKCINCGESYSFKTSTANLKTHLRRKHVDAYRSVVAAQEAAKTLERIKEDSPDIKKKKCQRYIKLSPRPIRQYNGAIWTTDEDYIVYDVPTEGYEGEESEINNGIIITTDHNLKKLLLKAVDDFQVAIFTEPSREFSEEERADFLDAIGNKLFEISENDEMPSFGNTIINGNLIVVTADNSFSCEWLLGNVPMLQFMDGSKMQCAPMSELPTMKKGFLWLPGLQRLTNEALLTRLSKQNRDLNIANWRILSRAEEPTGIILSIAVDEKSFEAIKERDNMLQWSTCRACFTPL